MATTLNFGKLFAKSPFKPMKKHMSNAMECVEQLPSAMEAYFAGDKSTLKDLKHKIFELEDDADKILEEMQTRLPKTMFMPVDRRDLLSVLEMQEAIADRTQDIIGQLNDLPIDVPAELHKPILRLTKRAVEATKGAEKIVNSFDDLIETGFKGPDVSTTQNLIHEVVRIETTADTIGTDITHGIFEHLKDMDAVSVIFLYQLVQWIDDIADYSEKLAIRSRLFLAR